MENNKKLKWYIVNKEYVKYLQQFDNKVQNIEYGKALKPYIGIVLQVNAFQYYVPTSSVNEKKTKYNKMKEGMDLIKIHSKNRLLGVLNINNMIPIVRTEIKELKYKDISKVKEFKDNREKEKYIYLLQEELKIIRTRQEDILKCAKLIHKEKTNNSESKLAKRCCDFKTLEEKAKLYKRQ